MTRDWYVTNRSSFHAANDGRSYTAGSEHQLRQCTQDTLTTHPHPSTHTQTCKDQQKMVRQTLRQKQKPGGTAMASNRCTCKSHGLQGPTARPLRVATSCPSYRQALHSTFSLFLDLWISIPGAVMTTLITLLLLGVLAVRSNACTTDNDCSLNGDWPFRFQSVWSLTSADNSFRCVHWWKLCL